MSLAFFILEVNIANNLARQRVFQNRLNSLDAYNDTEFISRYRITRGIFIQLHEKLSDLFFNIQLAILDLSLYQL